MLSDRDIQLALDTGRVTIDPFDPAAIQPASLDLRLGNAFYRFKWAIQPFNPPVIDPAEGMSHLVYLQRSGRLFLHPNEMVLGVTAEKVTLDSTIAASLNGKSSLARLGLMMHITAGFIDPGFSGYITLELVNMAPFPILLRAGMWIAQLTFFNLQTPCQEPYGAGRGSRYTDAGEKAEPTVSRNFEKWK